MVKIIKCSEIVNHDGMQVQVFANSESDGLPPPHVVQAMQAAKVNFAEKGKVYTDEEEKELRRLEDAEQAWDRPAQDCRFLHSNGTFEKVLKKKKR